MCLVLYGLRLGAGQMSRNQPPVQDLQPVNSWLHILLPGVRAVGLELRKLHEEGQQLQEIRHYKPKQLSGVLLRLCCSGRQVLSPEPTLQDSQCIQWSLHDLLARLQPSWNPVPAVASYCIQV